eukprot:2933360-Karenia_brevis.AAC.1
MITGRCIKQCLRRGDCTATTAPTWSLLHAAVLHQTPVLVDTSASCTSKMRRSNGLQLLLLLRSKAFHDLHCRLKVIAAES